MSERLPMLGSPEFFERCAVADREIGGNYFEKEVKQRKVITIPPPTSNKAFPSHMQIRGLDLMVNDKKPPTEAAAMLYKETGIFITRGALKNWLHNYRKRERAAK